MSGIRKLALHSKVLKEFLKYFHIRQLKVVTNTFEKDLKVKGSIYQNVSLITPHI
jgi:hypothetical protein